MRISRICKALLATALAIAFCAAPSQAGHIYFWQQRLDERWLFVVSLLVQLFYFTDSQLSPVCAIRLSKRYRVAAGRDAARLHARSGQLCRRNPYERVGRTEKFSRALPATRHHIQCRPMLELVRRSNPTQKRRSSNHFGNRR